MFDLVSAIDTEKNSLCKRFEPLVFTVVGEALMQADACREAERGLYLLAVCILYFLLRTLADQT